MNKEKFIGIQNWLRDIQAYLKLDTDTEDVKNLDNSTSGIGKNQSFKKILGRKNSNLIIKSKLIS